MIPLRSESDPSLPARTPIANWLLAALVVACSLYVQPGVDALQQELVVAQLAGATRETIDSGAFEVARPDGLLGHLVLQRGEHFRLSQLVGVAFTHGDWHHLLGNVLLLLIAGGPLCRAIGNGRFVVVWLASAVVASIGALAFTDGAFSFGASGVVMGLVAACAVAAPTTRVWVLTHPLPFLLLAAGGLGFITLGGWGGLVATGAFMIAWALRALSSWGDGADIPEGLVARLFGFVLLRPRVAWLAGALVGLDLLGVVAGDGEGLVATVLRVIAGQSCHEAHLAGALGGLLLALSFGASAKAPAGVREEARAAWSWLKRAGRRARATWDALEAGEWPAQPTPVPTGALRRTRSPAVERARRRTAA